jgi:hypothetical protein
LYATERDNWIVKTLTALQAKVDHLTQLILKVVNDNVASTALPDNVALPVDSLEDLNHVEGLLLDENIKNKLVSHVEKWLL